MKRRVRSPLVWVGGKSRLVDWILPHLEVPCQSYVEPFGGSAAMLLNRPRVPCEVYNDLDQSLVRFLLCVREHPAELERLVLGLPYARAHHQAEQEWLRLGCPGRMTDLQFAARWWWLNLTGFGGQLTGGFGTAVDDRVPQVHRRIATVHEASARLRDVLIECEDFRVVIERYDTPDTLFYLDPPYVGCETVYVEGGMREADHRDLARMLGALQGKAAVSYYPCPLVDELYPEPHWRRITKRWIKSLGLLAHEGDAAPESTELLLLNYDPPIQQNLF